MDKRGGIRKLEEKWTEDDDDDGDKDSRRRQLEDLRVAIAAAKDDDDKTKAAAKAMNAQRREEHEAQLRATAAEGAWLGTAWEQAADEWAEEQEEAGRREQEDYEEALKARKENDTDSARAAASAMWVEQQQRNHLEQLQNPWSEWNNPQPPPPMTIAQIRQLERTKSTAATKAPPPKERTKAPPATLRHCEDFPPPSRFQMQQKRDMEELQEEDRQRTLKKREEEERQKDLDEMEEWKMLQQRYPNVRVKKLQQDWIEKQEEIQERAREEEQQERLRKKWEAEKTKEWEEKCKKEAAANQARQASSSTSNFEGGTPYLALEKALKPTPFGNEQQQRDWKLENDRKVEQKTRDFLIGTIAELAAKKKEDDDKFFLCNPKAKKKKKRKGVSLEAAIRFPKQFEAVRSRLMQIQRKEVQHAEEQREEIRQIAEATGGKVEDIHDALKYGWKDGVEMNKYLMKILGETEKKGRKEESSSSSSKTEMDDEDDPPEKMATMTDMQLDAYAEAADAEEHEGEGTEIDWWHGVKGIDHGEDWAKKAAQRFEKW